MSKLKIDHTKYISIANILKENPWCRNLMLLTPRGTGKSSDARNIIKSHTIPQWYDKDTPNKEYEAMQSYMINWIKDIVGTFGVEIRASWIRNTEKAIKTSVINKFQALFSGEHWKVKSDGVYYKNEALPRVLFVSLNAPWNYLDNNLCCRINVYDEIIDYDISISGEEKQNTIKNFSKTFGDIFQGITRPYHRNGNMNDEPYLIMLGNPRQAQTDLFELFECDFDWDKANRSDIFIIRRKMKFIGMWLSKFKLPQMSYSLGNIKDIGNNYPPMRERDKRVIYFYRVKQQFKPQWAITYNKTTYAGEYMQWGDIEIIYLKELETPLDYKDLKIYCYDWIDKEPYNIWSPDFFQQFKAPYKRSAIAYSTTFAQQQLKNLFVRIIRENRE